MEFPDNLPLARYEKVERVALGLVLPLFIFVWTLFNLFAYSQTLYVFHDEVVYFYGNEAYFVCCFWLGLALAIWCHFRLSKTKRYYRLALTLFKFSVCLVLFGTFAALWYTFDLYNYV